MTFADDLQQRLYAFALDIIRFCRTLPGTRESSELASQVRRASTGASANYRACRRARSRAEWLSKLGVVVEELDEAEHWLTMIADAGVAQPPQNLITECRSLRAILAKSVASGRRTKNRNPILNS